MTVRMSWNGGRNGWASFIVGFGWMPAPKGYPKTGWGIHIYLGLWVLTLKGNHS